MFNLCIVCPCSKYKLAQLYQLNQKSAFHFIPQYLENVLLLTLKDQFAYNISKTV